MLRRSYSKSFSFSSVLQTVTSPEDPEPKPLLIIKENWFSLCVFKLIPALPSCTAAWPLVEHTVVVVFLCSFSNSSVWCSTSNTPAVFWHGWHIRTLSAVEQKPNHLTSPHSPSPGALKPSHEDSNTFWTGQVVAVFRCSVLSGCGS